VTVLKAQHYSIDVIGRDRALLGTSRRLQVLGRVTDAPSGSSASTSTRP
jgi:hypothetical protein